MDSKLTSNEKSKRPVPVTRKAKSMDEVKENCLSQIPGVGLSMSKKLLKRYGTIQNICNLTKKDLKEIDKLGDKTAEKILLILTELYHHNGKNK
jgi:ERCC4-type nuclease